MSDSHSDVDDELLALAGGGDGSSDEGSRPPSRQRSRTRSRSRSRSQSARPANDSPQRSSATKKVPAKKRRGSNESEDEGEASEPGSPDSGDESVPMDESDSDDDDSASPGKAVDDEDKYPVDGLFTSHAEKKEIYSMREVEREQIIAERELERERLRQKALLRRLVTNNEDKQKKRKGDGDVEESQRKKARSSTKTGLDALKRARAEKNDRRNRRENERRRERSPSYRSVSSRSRHGSEESDTEWTTSKKKKRSKSPPEEAQPAELGDIERCRLSRTRFAKVAFYPGFDEALKGCYVRVHIGPDPETKMPIYRMALITGFSTGRPYAVENDRGKPIVVDKYVVAAHGKAEREWPWIACSEGNFTDAEWNRYQIVCKNEGLAIPKKPQLLKKMDDINDLINRKWTDFEISEKLNKQNALKDRFSGAERARIEQSLAQARAHGNDELAAELQDKLDRTPMPRLAFQTSLKKNTPSKPAAPSQQDRLAEKNALNRQLNAKHVREAQLAERRKTREIEEAIARGEDVHEDLSRRVKTRIKFVHTDDDANSKSQTGSGVNTPNGTPKGKSKDAKDDSALIARLQAAKAANGVPTIHKTLTDEDIIGALDLDIDIEID